MVEQEFDPNSHYPFPLPNLNPSIIYIRPRTYELLKRCIVLCREGDNLSKSYDDRILEMLLSVFKGAIYRMCQLFEHHVKELGPSPQLKPLYLRSQTYHYLKCYTFIFGNLTHSIRDIDTGLEHLLEKILTKITIMRLKCELLDQEIKEEV